MHVIGYDTEYINHLLITTYISSSTGSIREDTIHVYNRNVMQVGICTQHGAVSEVPALFQRRLQPPYFLASTIATAPKITGALPYLSCGLQNPTRYVYSATAFQKTGVLHRWTISRWPVLPDGRGSRSTAAGSGFLMCA